jgi:hypothetical protein
MPTHKDTDLTPWTLHLAMQHFGVETPPGVELAAKLLTVVREDAIYFASAAEQADGPLADALEQRSAALWEFMVESYNAVRGNLPPVPDGPLASIPDLASMPTKICFPSLAETLRTSVEEDREITLAQERTFV